MDNYTKDTMAMRGLRMTCLENMCWVEVDGEVKYDRYAYLDPEFKSMRIRCQKLGVKVIDDNPFKTCIHKNQKHLDQGNKKSPPSLTIITSTSKHVDFSILSRLRHTHIYNSILVNQIFTFPKTTTKKYIASLAVPYHPRSMTYDDVCVTYAGMMIAKPVARSNGVDVMFYAMPPMEGQPIITQKMFNNTIFQPLIESCLIHGRRFDIRCIVVSMPNNAFIYRHRYARLCHSPPQASTTAWQARQASLTSTYISNQSVTRRLPSACVCDHACVCVWPVDLVMSDVEIECEFEGGRVVRGCRVSNREDYENVKEQMQVVAVDFMGRKRGVPGVGHWEILGFDFLVDRDMKVWLLEVNSCPTMRIKSDRLKNFHPQFMESLSEFLWNDDKLEHENFIPLLN